MSANFQATNPRKGLATASLVLGIISIPTVGLLLVGGVTGIILGVVALNKIKNNPQIYGGKGLAIGGIVTSVISIVLMFVFVLAAIALPKLTDSLKQGRETAAIKSLLTIHQNQKQYHQIKSRFGTLQDLHNSGLLDNTYLNHATVSGYVYTDSAVSAETYCVQATRASNNTAYRDFIVCEDGLIRFLESKTKTLVKRGEGNVLNGDDAAAPEALPPAKP